MTRADLAKYRVHDLSEAGGGPDDADIEDGSTNSDHLLDTMLRWLGKRPKYDVILCDPYHSYSDSLNDLRNAWILLVPGGTLVVHDCNPATAQHASPLQRDGIWCGRTFEAFLDFVREADLPYFTIDADHGIGVIRKERKGCGNHPFDSLFKTMAPAGRALWDGTPPDDDRFAVFDSRRSTLLNLVTVEEFSTICQNFPVGSSDRSESAPDESHLLLVEGLPRTGRALSRSRTEIVARYEEMVGRYEVERAADLRRIAELGARIDQQRLLIEELRNSMALSRIRLEQYDELVLQIAELGDLLEERNSDLRNLRSSATFRLQAAVLRLKLPLMLWRAGASLARRLRRPASPPATSDS